VIRGEHLLGTARVRGRLGELFDAQAWLVAVHLHAMREGTQHAMREGTQHAMREGTQHAMREGTQHASKEGFLHGHRHAVISMVISTAIRASSGRHQRSSARSSACSKRAPTSMS